MTRQNGSAWNEVPLGDLATFRNGINYNKNNFGKGIKVINVKDFQDRNTPDYSELDEIKPEGVVRDEDILLNNDLLFVRSNGNRDLIGRTLFIKNATERITHSAFTIRLRFLRNDLDPRFYAYLFKSPIIRKVLAAHGGGTNISNLNQEILSNLSVPMPSYEEQKRISAVLSQFDDLIENNTRRIEILEEIVRMVHKEWFIHFRFPQTKRKTQGKLPEGWKQIELGNVAAEIRKSVEPANIGPETPYIGLEHLPRRSIALREWGTAADVKSTKLAFCKGDILFGKIRPYFHKVIVAPMDGVCSSDTIVIRPKDQELFSVILSYTSSDDFVSHATQTSNGTKMPRANWSVLTKYPILVPSTDVLERFNQIVCDMVAQIQILSAANRNLHNARNLLLPKLVFGEIDLSEVDKYLGGLNQPMEVLA